MKRNIYFLLHLVVSSLLILSFVVAGCIPATKSPQNTNTASNVTEQTQKNWVYIHGSDVNVRQYPGTDTRVIDCLADGTKMENIGVHRTFSGYHWVKVRLEDGRTGYVAHRYLRSNAVRKDKNDPPDLSIPLNNIRTEQIKIGPVSSKSTNVEIFRDYGRPDYQDRNCILFRYNNGTEVGFWGDVRMGPQQLHHFEVVADRNIRTEDGICLGMPESSILRTYGEPLKVSKNENGDIFYNYSEHPATLYFQCRGGNIIKMGIHVTD